jgi:hypothetical protein
VPEVGGPEVHRLKDLLGMYLRTRGKHRLIAPVPTFGRAAKAFRNGANLAPDRAEGQLTWESFLAQELGRQADALVRG